jgi:cell surface protein SprA
MGNHDPENIKETVEFDPATNTYTITQKAGEVVIGQQTLTAEQYQAREMAKQTMDYWREREQASGEDKGNSLLPPLRLGDKDGGLGKVEIRPQGTAEIIMGVRVNRNENPNIPLNQRTITTFQFDQNIQVGVLGKIGDRINLNTNFNTQSIFAFENLMNLKWEGKEDDILQLIEFGNVNMGLTGQLIQGSSALFGVKSKLRFGRLEITSVFSQQQGQRQSITVKGGAQVTPYEFIASRYEANRHFFLGDYFTNIYDNANAQLPFIASPVNITRLEVWVTNRINATENVRNIVALIRLGENLPNVANAFPDNTINQFNPTTLPPSIRDITSQTLFNVQNNGTEIEKVTNARLLTPNEYVFDPLLGYISLNQALNADEVLAVAYEYTAGGKTYRVGEFSQDVNSPNAIVVKLLKASNLDVKQPNWPWMMKNIYNIGGFNIGPEDFILNLLYQDTETGVKLNYFPNAPGASGVPMLQLFNMDRLNPQGDQDPDGFFDFIENRTIRTQTGRVILPVREPFSTAYLRKIFTQANINNPGVDIESMVETYAFDELYRNIQQLAELNLEKNRYYIAGSYQGASGSEINLNAFNVPQGSVTVTAGGQTLMENTDYTVDYSIGRVRIINESVLNSGLPINISMESNATFNIQQKRLVGTHLDYRINKDFLVGATIMNLRERPLTQKIDIGQEPVDNTIWGLNMAFNREVPLITRLVDKIPGINTKAPSMFTFNGEFAHLIPGVNNIINQGGENGVSFIDDFEGAETPIDVRTAFSWKLGSVPQHNSQFPNAQFFNDLRHGYNRALMTWFIMDPLFFRQNTLTPQHISNDPVQRANNYLREVRPQEVFPGFQPNFTMQQANQLMLDIHYYPRERGPYNFDAAAIDPLSSDRLRLLNPRDNFGAMMRRMETTDWDGANVTYIEFWMMDPFMEEDLNQLKEWDSGDPGALNENMMAGGGGDFLIQIGNMSEDLLRDGRMSYENGLPTSTDPNRPVIETVWGRVPVLPPINNQFDNDPATRASQDVGYDGLSDADEQTFFQNYIQQVSGTLAPGSNALNELLSDPAGDNFRHYTGEFYDANNNVPGQNYIHSRYKRFLGAEGNSPAVDNVQAYGQVPNSEDANNNFTLDQPEGYYQYKISMRPGDLQQIGENFITDILETTASVPGPSGGTVNKPVRWLQFRIPIRSEQREQFGGINDFRSIRFMRMALTGFPDDIFLRMATLQLVRSDWRPFDGLLAEAANTWKDEANFNVTTVNIEENTQKQPFNYVLPPGITREIDPANPQLQQLNEQALVLNACDLKDGEAKAVFKNAELDLRPYRFFKMFVHLEEAGGQPLDSNDVTVFVRLGMDATENYYEFEVSLRPSDPSITPNAASGNPNDDPVYRRNVWPLENELNIELALLPDLKLQRNKDGKPSNELISTLVDGRRISVLGNPNLANIRSIMIGVRNPHKTNNPWQDGSGGSKMDDGAAKCVQVWVNEMRATDYFEAGGWAAIARSTLNLADFGQLALAVSTTRFGFGSIEQRPMERARENTNTIDFTGNLELGKFFGQKAGVNIPVFFGYSNAVSNPQFNPLDPDILFINALDALPNDFARDSLRQLTQTVISRKSFNVTNMRKQRGAGGGAPKLYDISNFTASYAYTEDNFRDTRTEYNNTFEHRAALSYQFSPTVKYWEPFKKSKSKSKWFKPIKELNFTWMPKRLGFNFDVLRDWNEFKLRNNTPFDLLILPTFRKNFNWSRSYEFQYNPTRSITLTFSALNMSRVDEPEMNLDSTVRAPRQPLGRNTDYNHRFEANYNIPINKFPIFDWINATVGYGGDYRWTSSVMERDPLTGQFTQGRWGNIVQNSQNIKGNATLNFVSLYNKSKYLKKLHAPPRPGGKEEPVDSTKTKVKIVRFEATDISFKEGRKKTIKHNLRTEQITITVIGPDGKEVKGKTEIIDDRRARWIPEADVKKATVRVEGKRVRKPFDPSVILNTAVRLATGLRNVSINYTESNATILPGYNPGADMFGIDFRRNSIGPDFAFGKQYSDIDLVNNAINTNWLARDSTMNLMFMRSHSSNLTANATYEPFRGFRVTLTANRTYAENFQSNYRYVPSEDAFVNQNPLTMGNFSISYFSMGTFFGSDGPNFTSRLFNNMLAFRADASARLAQENPNAVFINGAPFQPGFGPNQADVLLFSFLAAYRGTDIRDQSFDIFPQIPVPNWRLQFDGFKNIPWVKKRFKNVVLTHGYQSTYTVAGFQSNNVYNERDPTSWIGNPFNYDQLDLNNDFVPRFFMNSVTIQESFNPLIKIDATHENGIQVAIEIKSSRNISLNFPNNQVTENNSFDVNVGAGYRIPKFKLPILINGRQPNNALNMRIDVGIRDNVTVLRKIAEEVQQITAGQQAINIRAFVEYDITKAVTFRVFFDHIENNPFISNQFPTGNSNGGISLRFNLAP